MKRFCRAVFVLAALAAPAFAAVDGSRARVVTVVVADYQFTPDKLVFQRGVAYRLHIENRGKETHEFHAPAFFSSVELGDAAGLSADKTEIQVQPGQAKDVIFVPKKAGHYPLFCPDHDWAGMTGEITVE